MSEVSGGLQGAGSRVTHPRVDSPRVLCTAGHVDHGKSTLVRALTGVDPDRLAEEKRRGMTIELGFVEWRLPGGGSVAIIDTPGHQRLIRTMAAGAHAVDGVLLLVAATEGVMPQTREHLDICRMLGAGTVIGVVSMIDRVDERTVVARTLEVTALLREAGVVAAGVVAVSAVTGTGLVELAALVEARLPATAPRPARGDPRLHVDRAFVMKGRGVVVTGTLIDGALQTGDAVRILPDGIAARVRQLERHGEMVDVAMPGARTAVNLHGVTAEQVTRGQTLVRHGPLRAHSRFGVRATSLGDAGFSGRNPQHLTLHHGTRSCAAELRVVAEDDRNGQPAVFAELRTTVPLVVLPGDRFLLRATSADQTVGGGVILDAAPPARRRSRSDIVDDLTRRGDGLAEDVLLAEVSRAAHGLRVDEARMLTGLNQLNLEVVASRIPAIRRVALPDGERLVAKAVLQRVRESIIDTLARHHQTNPAMPGMDVGLLRRSAGSPLAAAEVDELLSGGAIQAPLAGVVALAGWSPDASSSQELLTWLASRGLDPAPATEVRSAGFGDGELRRLIMEGKVTPLGRGFLARSTVTAARVAVLGELRRTGSATAGELCRVMGVTRRVGIPVLELFDAQGVTRRDGDRREAGWREREGNDPSGDAASAPPSRFEDGEAHLDPSTPVSRR